MSETRKVTGNSEIINYRQGDYFGQLKKANTGINESKVLTDSKGTAVELTPPYDFGVLTDFFDISTYHQQCITTIATHSVKYGYNFQTDDENLDVKTDKEVKAAKDFIREVELFNKNSFTEILFNMMIDKLLFGNAWIEIAINNLKRIGWFKHIPGRYCTIKTEAKEGKEIITLIQRVAAKVSQWIIYDPGSAEASGNYFYQIKNYHPKSDYFGVPGYIPALGVMALDRSAVEYNIRNFDNNMMLDLIITLIGAEFGAKSKANMKSFFNNNLKGVENAGKSLILEFSEGDKEKMEMKVEKISKEVKEAGFRYLRADSKEEITAAHKVPPRLVGIMSSSQLGGTGEYQSQLTAYRDLVIKPNQGNLEWFLNEVIFPNAVKGWTGNWRIKFDTFDVKDATDDATYYQNMMNFTDEYGNKVYKINEIRQEQGLEPRDDLSGEALSPSVIKGLETIKKAVIEYELNHE